jgi:hypothetical protein
MEIENHRGWKGGFKRLRPVESGRETCRVWDTPADQPGGEAQSATS